MKIGPREQLILVVVGLVAALVLAGALIVWPQFQRQGKMDAEISAAQTGLQTSESLLLQRQTSKNRAAETDVQWLALASLVPDSPDLPSLIIDLQDAAFASGVQLQSVTPADPKAGTDASYMAIPMEVTIWGTWADTVDYLKRINKMSRGIRIVESGSSTLVSAPSANPPLPDWSEATILQIEAYAIPTPSKPAAPAVP